MSVLVVLEQRGGKWNRMSFEALAAGQKIGESQNLPVASAVIGTGIEGLAKEAAAFSTSKVYVVDDGLLGDYTPDGYTAALEQLIKSVQPEIVVFPHTYQVRDFGPKLATRFGTALVSDVVDLRADNGSVVFVRQLFQGKLSADVRAAGNPQFVSVQAGAFRAVEPSAANSAVEKFAAKLDASQIRSEPEPPFREAQRSVDLGRQTSLFQLAEASKRRTIYPSSKR